MKTLKWLASASLAVVMFPALYAEPHCPGNAASIRPRFVEQSIIMVPVVLNDSGPFDFVLDTAAQVTTIDPALASDLHLNLEGTAGVTGAGFSTRASYAQLESLQAGTYAIKNSLILIQDISDARVYGVIHFRTDQTAGARLGKAIGRAIYKNNLRAGHDNDGDDNCDDD